MKEVIKKVEDYLEGKPKGITLNGPITSNHKCVSLSVR